MPPKRRLYRLVRGEDRWPTLHARHLTVYDDSDHERLERAEEADEHHGNWDDDGPQPAMGDELAPAFGEIADDTAGCLRGGHDAAHARLRARLATKNALLHST